jgi:outer membrane immunogenic protein
MRQMRLFVLWAVTVVGGSDALAGGIPDSVLRGSSVSDYAGQPAVQPRYVPGVPIYYRWQGLYAGGHVGYSNAGADFRNSTPALNFLPFNDLVLSRFAGWTPALSKVENNKAIFGGFVGYNFQMNELVLSAEANYNYGGFEPSISDSITRTFADDTGAPAGHHYLYTATLTAGPSARLHDFGTLRARAGFVFDRFLPYAFAGLALGRVDVSRSATLTYLRRDIPDAPLLAEQPFAFGPVTKAVGKESVVAYGYAVGFGLEAAVARNVFLRGEWEYVQFIPVEDYKIRLNTFRVGLGVKF